jgi:alkylation response protein AidB-like acyl-CoA dehydrogenase
MKGEALLDRVRAALPALEAEAAESEKLRRPTDAAIAVLEQTRCFELLVPRAYGGLELDLDVFLECALTLGEADASLAWVASFYIEHNWLLCQFPEAFQRELFADRSSVRAPAALFGESTVREERGGFLLDGRWHWASGAMHAEWVMVGGAVDPANPATVCFFALPADEVRIDDVWRVDGLCGTGSNDIVVEETFVPRERSAPLLEFATGNGIGAKLHGSPIYASPMAPILMTAAASPTVGQARSVVRRFREKATARARALSSVAERDRSSVQGRLAEAAHEVHEAELVMRDVIAEVMRRRGDASRLERARWSLALTRAVHGARRAIQRIADVSGGGAHFQRDPLQRAVRDANTASSHVAFDWDARHELWGRVQLGLEADGFLF